MKERDSVLITMLISKYLPDNVINIYMYVFVNSLERPYIHVHWKLLFKQLY